MANTPEPARSLLIVEDDDRLRERLARALRERGYEVREAADYGSALAAIREDSPEYMIVDLRIPGAGNGVDLVREVKAIDSSTVVVVLTGYGSIATAVEAVRLGATEYLTKPADVDQILAALNRTPRGVVGSDEPMQVPSLGRVEWEHINRVLADCGGNVSEAARLLNIHRRSLQRKLSRFPSNR